MAHFVHVALRLTSGLLGAVFLMALFLFEPEEGKIQSKLEDWWVKLDDSRGVALSFTTRFAQAVARLSGRTFDALFGKRLFSVRAFATSVSFSLASLAIGALTFGTLRSQSLAQLGPLLSSLGFLYWWLGLAVFPAVLEGSELRIRSVAVPLLWVWYLLIVESIVKPMVWIVWFLDKKWGRASAVHAAEGVLVLLLFSFACDATCIAAVRGVFRMAANNNRLLWIACLLIVNLFLAIAFFIAPIVLGLYVLVHFPSLKFLGLSMILFGFSLNTIDVIACLVFFVIAFLLFAHHLMWPVASRPLYALQRCGIVERRKWFGVTGAALVCYSLGLTEWFWRVLNIFFS